MMSFLESLKEQILNVYEKYGHFQDFMDGDEHRQHFLKLMMAKEKAFLPGADSLAGASVLPSEAYSPDPVLLKKIEANSPSEGVPFSDLEKIGEPLRSPQ
mmetsp:Transcript_11031/g.16751  ORF Transcript_11031/g.16751 Transcript_11031/m.16751 type:complete len:100 (-) Transcript_11031:27-326(-)